MRSLYRALRSGAFATRISWSFPDYIAKPELGNEGKEFKI